LISEDSVSDIHRRWYFTLLNPSSYKTSAAISIIASLGIVGINHISYVDFNELIIHFVVAIGITVGGFFLDLFLLSGSPTNRISKVIHVAAFSNSLWLVTILLGLLSNIIFSKNSDIVIYDLAGMFIASGLRYGIFVSVFGSRIFRSILISFILPTIFFSNLLSYNSSFILQDHTTVLVMGSSIFTIGVIWSVLADRAGYPNLKSTFKILQAFLSAWTENKQEMMEEIFETKSRVVKIRTKMIKFERHDDKQVFVVLPDIHPGPFNPIGGSNLPHKLFKFFENNALVLHSISDHSLNLPTTLEVNKYLESLRNSVIKNSGNECTLPFQTKSNDFTLTCMDFKNSVMMIVSKDSGMEDLPTSIRVKIEQYAKELEFSDIMIVDAHNALGKKISSEEEKILFDFASSSLKKLKGRQYHSYKIGYANSMASGFKFIELGGAGIGVIDFQIDNENHLVGWSDSNNLVNGLRERILSELNEQGFNMLEICSSDTHSSSGKRTRQGYYALGNVTSYKDIIRAFEEVSQKAVSNTTTSSFSFLDSYSQIKLMGRDQFDNYAAALNKSMNITKVSLGITIALYIMMLVIL
jgi:putative membrane protein